MKKNRVNAVTIHALCTTSAVGEIMLKIFKETTTLGVRTYTVDRHSLVRDFRLVSTKYGDARVKTGLLKNGEVVNMLPEYDDIVSLSDASGVPFKVIHQEVMAALYK